MTRSKAYFILFLSVWPFLYMVLFFVIVFGFVLTNINQPQQTSGPMPAAFVLVFILHFLTAFEIMGMIAYYIYHIFKTPHVPQDKKALWAVVIFLGNVMAMPIYWYLYIWKPLQETSSTDQ
jgi:hypothetical protein